MIGVEIKTAEEQEKNLKEKLLFRTQNILLTDETTDGYLENRAVLLKACEDGLDGFKIFCDTFGWIQNPQAKDSKNKDIPFCYTTIRMWLLKKL